jgi:uncharacterized Zn finger protein (UPF0148 family)
MTEPTTLLCELCQTPMTAQEETGGAVRYYFCAGCGRWVASNYGDEMMRRAKSVSVDRRERPRSQDANEDLDRLKAHLARWLEQIEENDPYRTLGLPPSASEEAVRARFHELAMRHHPDHGGDAAQMRRVIAAYDRIKNGKPPANAHQVVVERRPVAVRRRVVR